MMMDHIYGLLVQRMYRRAVVIFYRDRITSKKQALIRRESQTVDDFTEALRKLKEYYKRC